MPAIGGEEVEELVEGSVGDLDGRMSEFDGMRAEEGQVESWNGTHERSGGSRGRGLAEPMLEGEEEVLIKVLLWARLTKELPVVSEVVGVAIEATVMLQESEQHETFEHELSEIAAQTLRGKPLDMRQQGVLLRVKVLKKALQLDALLSRWDRVPGL